MAYADYITNFPNDLSTSQILFNRCNIIFALKQIYIENDYFLSYFLTKYSVAVNAIAKILFAVYKII